MPAHCPNCGSHEIASDGASGTCFCTECGTVVEEGTIVNEVSFNENANGSSSVVGQFVSSTGGTRSFRRGVPGFSRESREQTIENGTRTHNTHTCTRTCIRECITLILSYSLTLTRSFAVPRSCVSPLVLCLLGENRSAQASTNCFFP